MASTYVAKEKEGEGGRSREKEEEAELSQGLSAGGPEVHVVPS